MSVDLDKLPADEEMVRRLMRASFSRDAPRAIQNVLDALNYFRCLALHRAGEIDRLRAALTGVDEDVGFTAQDYGDLAKAIRMDADKPYLSAILSNNFNLILGALDAAALAKATGGRS